MTKSTVLTFLSLQVLNSFPFTVITQEYRELIYLGFFHCEAGNCADNWLYIYQETMPTLMAGAVEFSKL